MATKRLVLLGAGHAHLYTIKRLRAFVESGFECTVVAPDCFWYSGLATGVLGGQYPADLDRVEVVPMIQQQGGTFLQDHVERLVPEQQEIHLHSGEVVPYDVVSLNLGSQVPVEKIPGAREFGTPVKPIRGLLELPNAIQAWSEEHPKAGLQIIVIGGGPTGCELATNLQQHLKRLPREASLILLAAGSRLLPQLPAGAADKAAQVLKQRGIHVRFETRVEQITAREVVTNSGERLPYDFLLHAFGLVPSPIPRDSGLRCDAEGSMLVTPQLHSIDDTKIFGGGDCIAWQDRPLAKVGVYAIRESPVLFHNLMATLKGEPLQEFRPQRRFLLILNLAGRKGLAIWGPFSWYSRIAFWWKDWLDRGFLKQYQSPEGT